MLTELARIETLIGCMLPRNYATLLTFHCGACKACRGQKRWKFATLPELLSPIQIGTNSNKYVLQLKLYAPLIAKIRESSSTVDTDGNDYPLNRLGDGLAIADENGDILFLDRQDSFSVWCFYHDGGTVERQAPDSLEWLAAAKIEPDPPVPAGITHYITDVLIPRGDVPLQRFLVKFGDQQIINKTERAIINHLASRIAEFHSLDPETNYEKREAILSDLQKRGEEIRLGKS
jgi:hypothetical protein